ncbi:neto-1 family protein [Megaselia abdita]
MKFWLNYICCKNYFWLLLLLYIMDCRISFVSSSTPLVNIKTATSTTTTTTNTTTALLPVSGRENRDTSSVARAASESPLTTTTIRTGTSTISTSFDGYTTTTAINSMLGGGMTKTTSFETYTSMFYKNYSFPDKGPRDLLTTKRGGGDGDGDGGLGMVVVGRSERDAEQNDDDPNAKCRPFIEGEKNTFYHPDYPNNYPKNINCTRIIEAPKGQLIRLDFRNFFHIEENNNDCKFDYLEIRDGPYGFSNLIGKYCGEEFPPEITSKERHLWLHFHSDESIEYSGFQAVYEFIDRRKDAISTELNCTIERGGYEGFVNSTDVPQYVTTNVSQFKIPLDCMWRIQVETGWKIQVKFLKFSLSKPNDCDRNFIDIFAEDTNIPSRMKNFCGSTGESVSSKSNVLHVRFFAEHDAITSSFDILYTAYRDKPAGQLCADNEYDCEDATCIDAELKCNGRANCKFRWDEDNCGGAVGGMSEHVIIIIVVFGLILSGMFVTFLVNCIRKIMEDQKIIREHIRQSKDSHLDEVGRRSKEKRSHETISHKLTISQKHSQTSLQILDDVSNRYYKEMVPIAVHKESKVDMVVQTSIADDSETTPSTPSGMEANERIGVCDMGCQTRESLFQMSKSTTPLRDNASVRSGSNMRFSTFGYETPPPPPPVSSTYRLSTNPQMSSIDTLDSDNVNYHQRTQSIGPICHHHHQHQQFIQKQLLDQQQQMNEISWDVKPQHHLSSSSSSSHHHTKHHKRDCPAADDSNSNSHSNSSKSSSKKHSKNDEQQSKVFIDVGRHSAPDVIIMTH